MTTKTHLVVSLSAKEHNRIFNKIVLEPQSQCWIWRGAVDLQGYGLVHYKGKTERIHRIMYALFREPIPRGIERRKYAQIDHVCNNKTCCNPKHLRLITQHANIIRGNGPSAINKRKERCKYGHVLPIASQGKGARVCKTCDSIRHKLRMVGPKREYWLEKQRESQRRYQKNHAR